MASIPDQVKELHSVRDKERLIVRDEFSEARSAMIPDTRPVFREMLDRIIRGEANGILCWHLNRLYRNQKEYGEVAYLLQTGKILCIKTPEREYHPEDHTILMAVEASMATQYSRDLKRDVSRGSIGKADNGWYPLRPKPGYFVDPITKHVDPHPDTFPLLRRAVELLLSKTANVEEARLQLNGWGYRSPRTPAGGDKPMTRAGMYRFVADRFYVGEFRYRGIWQPGRHVPLMTRQEFEELQSMRKRRLKAKVQRHRFAYTGLIRCGVCGCQITGEQRVKHYATTGNRQTYTYYHCTGKRGCVRYSVTEEMLEAKILNRIHSASLAPDFIDWAIKELRRDEKDQALAAFDINPRQSEGMRVVTLKLESLWEMRHAGEISADDFRERKARYDSEMSALKTQSDFLASRTGKNRDEIIKALSFSRDAYRRFTEGGVEEKRQVARELGHSYVLTLENLEIRSHPLIEKFLTFERRSHPSQQVESGGSFVLISVWRSMLDELRTLISG